jgi:hypothetical protein
LFQVLTDRGPAIRARQSPRPKINQTPPQPPPTPRSPSARQSDRCTREHCPRPISLPSSRAVVRARAPPLLCSHPPQAYASKPPSAPPTAASSGHPLLPPRANAYDAARSGICADLCPTSPLLVPRIISFNSFRIPCSHPTPQLAWRSPFPEEYRALRWMALKNDQTRNHSCW